VVIEAQLDSELLLRNVMPFSVVQNQDFCGRTCFFPQISIFVKAENAFFRKIGEFLLVTRLCSPEESTVSCHTQTVRSLCSLYDVYGESLPN
jgi:hypothetical protein